MARCSWKCRRLPKSRRPALACRPTTSLSSLKPAVTLDDAYSLRMHSTSPANLAIKSTRTNPMTSKFFVTGTATFGDSVSFNAYLYANLDVQGGHNGRLIFLVQEPASNPIESFGGGLDVWIYRQYGDPLTPQAPVATTSQQTITLSDGTTETYRPRNTPHQPTIGGFYVSLSGFLASTRRSDLPVSPFQAG